MATASPLPAAVTPGARLTTAQTFWLVAQAAVLLGIAAYRSLTNLEEFRLLWQVPTGVRMSVVALVLLGLYGASLLGGYWLINHLTQRNGSEPSAVRPILTFALSVVLFIFLYLPVVFVLLVGPAALSIQKNLLAG